MALGLTSQNHHLSSSYYRLDFFHSRGTYQTNLHCFDISYLIEHCTILKALYLTDQPAIRKKLVIDFENFRRGYWDFQDKQRQIHHHCQVYWNYQTYQDRPSNPPNWRAFQDRQASHNRQLLYYCQVPLDWSTTSRSSNLLRLSSISRPWSTLRQTLQLSILLSMISKWYRFSSLDYQSIM